MRKKRQSVHKKGKRDIEERCVYLPIRLTPIFFPLNLSTDVTSGRSAPVLMAQHSGVSTYVPTILYGGGVLDDDKDSAFEAKCFASPATQPSVRPMAMSISLEAREVIMCPVPEGKGIRVAEREKCWWAKWRGVEKCSVRRGGQ